MIKFYTFRMKFVVTTVAVPPLFQFLSLMETIDRQREEMGRSNR